VVYLINIAKSVGCFSHPMNHGINSVPVLYGVVQPLQHDGPGPFSGQGSVRFRIKRSDMMAYFKKTLELI